MLCVTALQQQAGEVSAVLDTSQMIRTTCLLRSTRRQARQATLQPEGVLQVKAVNNACSFHDDASGTCLACARVQLLRGVALEAAIVASRSAAYLSHDEGEGQREEQGNESGGQTGHCHLWVPAEGRQNEAGGKGRPRDDSVEACRARWTDV